MPVARLRDLALVAAIAAAVLTGDEPQVAHQLGRSTETAQIAQFR